MKKLLLFIATAAALGGTAYYLFLVRNGSSPMKFRLASVKRGDLERIVTSTGTLSAVGTVEIGAQVSADLKKILVDFNDKVKRGQVLAIFDDTLLKAEAQRAEAEVSSAQVKLEQAEAEYQRNQPLFKKGFLSETEFLTVKSNLESARAQLKVAQANLQSARTNLKYTVIRSPIDGTVIERSAEVGQTIVSRMTTPRLFVIAADLSKMQILADVDESDIGQIKEGQRVRFTVQTYPEHTFDGAVRQVRLQPKTVQNVVNYTVVVDASNERERLLPGMTATVDFLIEQKTAVLLVPNSAVQFQPVPEMIAQGGSPPSSPAGPGPGAMPGGPAAPKYRPTTPETPAAGGAQSRPAARQGPPAPAHGPETPGSPSDLSHRPRRSAGPPGSTPQSPGSPGGPPAPPPGNKGPKLSRVYLPNGAGKLNPIRFVAGTTDGIQTEVKHGPDLHEGTKVVIGYDEEKKKNKASERLRRGPGGPPPF